MKKYLFIVCVSLLASSQINAAENLAKKYASCSGVYLYNSEMMGIAAKLTDPQKSPEKFAALKKQEKADMAASNQFIKKALYDELPRAEAFRLKDSAYKAQGERQTRGRISQEALQQGMAEYNSTLAKCEKLVDDVF